MALRWEDERYVRIYTRDTVSWHSLGWEAQALFLLVLRKVDRAGLLDLGKPGLRGLAAMLRMPEDVVTRCLPLLVEDGCIEITGSVLVVVNFIEAQEATKSPVARQQESRLRRRDQVRAGLAPRQRVAVIYFIQSEHGGPIKIGRADDLAKRLVGLQTARPDKLVVLAAAPGTVQHERELHGLFSTHRDKGEWFHPAPEIMTFIQLVVNKGTEAFTVTVRDDTQSVTRHEMHTVTPIRSYPNLPSLPCSSGEREPVRFAALWGERTGILMPEATHLGAAEALLREYATVSGRSFDEVADAALRAFAKHVGSWTVPQPLTPQLFTRKWEEIQGVMGKGASVTTTSGRSPLAEDVLDEKRRQAEERERLLGEQFAKEAE